MIDFEMLEMREQDIEELALVHTTVWTEAYATYFPKEVLQKFNYQNRLATWKEFFRKNDPHTFLRLAKVQGQLAGFVAATVHPRDAIGFDAELMAINILRKFHNRGIGRALMLSAFEFCRARGAKNIYLWVATENESAIRFYKNIGAHIESHAKSELGVEHLCLSWIL